MFKYVIFFVVFTVGSLFGMKEDGIEIYNDSSVFNLESVLAKCNQKLNELGDVDQTIKDSYNDIILNIKWCHDYIKLQDCYMAHLRMKDVNENVALVKNNNIIGAEINHNMFRCIQNINDRFNDLKQSFKDKYDSSAIDKKLNKLLTETNGETLDKKILKLQNILFNDYCPNSLGIFTSISECKKLILQKNPRAKNELGNIAQYIALGRTVREDLKKIFQKMYEVLKASIEKEFSLVPIDKESNSNENKSNSKESSNVSSEKKSNFNEQNSGEKKSNSSDESSDVFIDKKPNSKESNDVLIENKTENIYEKLDELLFATDISTLNKIHQKLNDIFLNNFSEESKVVFDYIVECKECLLNKNPQANEKLSSISIFIEDGSIKENLKEKFQEMYEKLKDSVEKEFNSDPNDNELNSNENKPNSKESSNAFIIDSIGNEQNASEKKSNSNEPSGDTIEFESRSKNHFLKLQSLLKDFQDKITTLDEEDTQIIKKLYQNILFNIAWANNAIRLKCSISVKQEIEKISETMENIKKESDKLIQDNKIDKSFQSDFLSIIDFMNNYSNELDAYFKKYLNPSLINAELDDLLTEGNEATIKVKTIKLKNILFSCYGYNHYDHYDKILSDISDCKKNLLEKNFSQAKNYLSSIESFIKTSNNIEENLKNKFQEMLDKLKALIENKSNSEESKNVLIENKPDLSGKEQNSDENKLNLISKQSFLNQYTALLKNKPNPNELSSDENKPNLGGIDNEQSSNEQNSKKSNYGSIKLLFSFLTLQDPMFGVLYGIFCLVQHLIPSKTDNISKDFIRIKQTESKLGNPLSTLLKFVISFGITKYACYKGLMQQQLWILKLYHQYKQWQKTVVKHKFPRIANKFISYI